jgi:hypothetical protein
MSNAKRSAVAASREENLSQSDQTPEHEKVKSNLSGPQNPHKQVALLLQNHDNIFFRLR